MISQPKLAQFVFSFVMFYRPTHRQLINAFAFARNILYAPHTHSPDQFWWMELVRCSPCEGLARERRFRMHRVRRHQTLDMFIFCYRIHSSACFSSCVDDTRPRVCSCDAAGLHTIRYRYLSTVTRCGVNFHRCMRGRYVSKCRFI